MVSPRLSSSRRWVAALAGAGCLALTAGCMFGGSDDDSHRARSESCGLLSASSLKELTGDTKVKTGGRMASHDVRADVGLNCVIFDAATGKTILQITVSDTSDHSTGAAIRQLVLKERKTIPHCDDHATLPDSGYFCAQADQTLAAAAKPKRLIRFTATREARTRLTADNAPHLLDEVNSRVDRYDAANS